MPSEYITEGTLKDVLDFIGGIGKAISGRKYGNVSLNGPGRNGTAFNTTSIARATKDLTMSFPLLCTDTISPSTAMLITKAVERNNVSMLQMFIAAYHISANNGVEAIRMIHTNMDNSFRAEDLVDAVMGVGNFDHSLYEFSDISKAAGCKRPIINYAKFLENARQDFINTMEIRYPLSSFSESSVSDYLVSNAYGGVNVLKEANGTIMTNELLDGKAINKTIDDYLKNSDPRKAFKKSKDEQEISTKDALKAIKDEEQFEFQKFNAARSAKLGRDQYNLSKQNFDLSQKNYNHDLEMDAAKARRELFLKQLLDSDVKKANELQPTLMVVPFYYTSPNGEEHSHEFVAGVKSRLITCTSAEIIDQISRFKKQGVNLNNLVRATTKEISFAKEFIGGIEQAKIDAKKDSKLSKTNPIWRMLQARSSKSGIKTLIRIKGSKNAAAAITTLVISAQEADYLIENYGIDISNPIIAREFMENYNLLCLVIVDEQTEIAKFLYDGERYFSEYSFNTLDRENNGNDTRKLISLLNKTR